MAVKNSEKVDLWPLLDVFLTLRLTRIKYYGNSIFVRVSVNALVCVCCIRLDNAILDFWVFGAFILRQSPFLSNFLDQLGLIIHVLHSHWWSISLPRTITSLNWLAAFRNLCSLWTEYLFVDLTSIVVAIQISLIRSLWQQKPSFIAHILLFWKALWWVLLFVYIQRLFGLVFDMIFVKHMERVCFLLSIFL